MMLHGMTSDLCSAVDRVLFGTIPAYILQEDEIEPTKDNLCESVVREGSMLVTQSLARIE